MGQIILGVLGLYLVFQVVMGYRRGLIKSMLNLAAWILTFAIAYQSAGSFQGMVLKYVPEIQGTILTDQIAYLIAFTVIVILCKMIFSIIIRIINKINNIPGVGLINRAAGGILGLAKGFLVIAFVLFFISLMPYVGLNRQYQQAVGGSPMLQQMVRENPIQKMMKQQIQSQDLLNIKIK